VTTLAPRLLLAFSSLLLAAGGVVHAVAFNRARAAFAASSLPPFFGNTSKALWLADSTTLWMVAAVFGLIAARPAAATGPVVMLVALIPAATAVLIYLFLGSFFAGHLLLAAAAMAFFAGLWLPAQ
jgi:hypothetical protein